MPAIRYPQRRPLGRPATWQDLVDLPDRLMGEIVDGQLIVSPRPGAQHARTSSRLGVALGGPFDLGVGGPGGWVILDEPRIRFGHDVRVPDLAGWRTDRWPGAPRRGAIRILPDWICEVLSPSTEREDRTVKLHLYARERVGYVWLINPETHTLEAYQLAPDGWRLLGTWADEARVRVAPFDAIELDLSLLWASVLDEEDDDEP